MARKEVGATFVRKTPQPLKIVSRRGYGLTASRAGKACPDPCHHPCHLPCRHAAVARAAKPLQARQNRQGEAAPADVPIERPQS